MSTSRALLVLLALTGCSDGPPDGSPADEMSPDAPMVSPDAPPDVEPSTDEPLPAVGSVLYPEGARHSPVPPALAVRLQQISELAPHTSDVFAKIGDSITASHSFLACFEGAAPNLGSNTHVAPTLARYLGGRVDNVSPFARASVAAVDGTTAGDVTAGSPSPLERELAATRGHVALVMFGTNDMLAGDAIDEAIGSLWEVVDMTIARGVIPVLFTIPPVNGDPATDARIPAFNRLVRAIAQGHGIPLVDYHRELNALPDRGLSADDVHPSTAPGGACQLTTADLRYGYNLRNLLALEALTRIDAALANVPADADALVQRGTGTVGDPYLGALPLASLSTTVGGDPAAASRIDACTGAVRKGHARTYRLELDHAAVLEAHVVARAGTGVTVGIIDSTGCRATGTAASASVSAGTVHVVVASSTPGTDGEFVLSVAAR